VSQPPGGAPGLARPSERSRLSGRQLEIADFAITQFFFRPSDYFRLVDDLSRLGASRPIVPGVMPITNARTVLRMADMSGSAVPEELASRIDAVSDRPDEVHKIGVEVATELCEALLADGVPGLHFYTMTSRRRPSRCAATSASGRP